MSVANYHVPGTMEEGNDLAMSSVQEIFGIVTEEVLHAADDLDGAGQMLSALGSQLPSDGVPDRLSLPGGKTWAALLAAAHRIGSAISSEGSSTVTGGQNLHSFVDAVGTTEAMSSRCFRSGQE